MATPRRTTERARDTVDYDRALGSLVGLAIGDALGTTLEFTARDSGPVVSDLVGGGPFGLKAGEWTDDTSMALCLAESLLAYDGKVNPTDLTERFTRWYREGENSVTGRCFDIGIATRAALERFERTGETAASLRPDPKGAGNGTLMRLAPVALAAAPDAELAADLAEAQSRTTHRAELAHEACRLFATLLVEAMTGASKAEVLRPRRVAGELGDVAGGGWRGKSRDAISSSGFVLATLEAALWCVGTTDSFADAVLLAANLGDDADTVAAVTGQLAGALYGLSGIPEGWLAQLAWRDRIEEIGRSLLALRPEPDRTGRDDTAGEPADPTGANRFSWNDDDLRYFDDGGNEMTLRQVREQQVHSLRADVVDQSAYPDPYDPTYKPEPPADPDDEPPLNPSASGLTAETLLDLGFIDVASWEGKAGGLAYRMDGPNADVNRLRLEQANALYAFVRGEQVLYIGKTARSIKKRFAGYCRPGRQQVTNLRCNRHIKAEIAGGAEIRVLIFNPISQLHYGAFELNLAAGLEDALIAEFDPPWNGREKGQPISEEAEREEAEEPKVAPEPEVEAEPSRPSALPSVPFEIKLGQAYYEQGLINPGVAASQHLGRHGEPIEVSFDDGTEPVLSTINRVAQAGNVRVVGRNRPIARWFQRHFERGDVVQAAVLGPNRIVLHAQARVPPDEESHDRAPSPAKGRGSSGNVEPGRDTRSDPGALPRGEAGTVEGRDAGHRSRLADLVRFYELMARLETKLGGARTLAECSGRQDWPQRGVYVFMEPGELRTESGSGRRIVRVGTHALRAESQTTLWNRLSQHRGTEKTGSGNHRGSIFRAVVGAALAARHGWSSPTWGQGSSAPAEIRLAEAELEREVSQVIGAMPFLWLTIDDAPGAESLRGFVERNMIALLSNLQRAPLDSPSPGWLGHHSDRAKVRGSGLWNSDHVNQDYDPSFLDHLEAMVDGGVSGSKPAASRHAPMSPSPVLRIAEVAPPSGGCIGVTFAPGKKQEGAISGRHDRDLETDLDVVASWGAKVVVTLVEAHELQALQIQGLGAAVRRRGMAWLHLPIPDVTAPDTAFDLAWPAHAAQLHRVLNEGGKVLVHCKGGLGRAGTIAARLLVELGSRPDDAIAAVRAVRPGAIQTRQQEHWVGKDWSA